MSRPKSGKTKRDTALNLQGWFSYGDPNDAPYLKIIESYLQEGKSKKQIIVAALTALARFEMPEVLASMETPKDKMDRTMEDVLKAVSALTGLAQKMSSMDLGEVAQIEYDAITGEINEQLGNIQLSIGNSFTTHVIDGNDDDGEW